MRIIRLKRPRSHCDERFAGDEEVSFGAVPTQLFPVWSWRCHRDRINRRGLGNAAELAQAWPAEAAIPDCHLPPAGN